MREEIGQGVVGGRGVTFSEVAVEDLVAEQTRETRLVLFDIVWALPCLGEVHGLLASPAFISSTESRSLSSCTAATCGRRSTPIW